MFVASLASNAPQGRILVSDSCYHHSGHTDRAGWRRPSQPGGRHVGLLDNAPVDITTWPAMNWHRGRHNYWEHGVPPFSPGGWRADRCTSMPALMALAVLKGNKAHAMGSVMALLTLGHSLGMFTGSVIAGMMMDFSRLREAFLLGAVIMGMGIGLFFICTFKKSEFKQA